MYLLMFSSPYTFAAKIALILTISALTVIFSRYYVHMLQLEGYFISQFLPHLFKRIFHPKTLFSPAKQKKPLVYTARIKRLFVIISLVALFSCGAIVLCFNSLLSLLCVLLIPLASFIVLLSALIAFPIEKLIAKFYVLDAKRKLDARKDLKIIAITGSYGKTSTKFILSTILSEKFSVLTPPSSYNTTLGVVRVIRERLQPDDEIFICEMGSRHIGDIKEICSFVHPDAAIITSIGPQHLDTFGSIEGVKKGKFELIEALDKESFAVFASTNDDILSLYQKAECIKLTAGFNENDSLVAKNITVGCSGSAFTLVFPDKTEAECSTALLGKHNISNILVAAAAAYKLGLSIEQIVRGIGKIKPIEHRLQIVKQKPITIIDDAFNSSPNGASAALDVLKSFLGRRIIITPGFVELGDKLDYYHFELGKKIAECADIAILVGKKRTEKIVEGIGDFKNIYVVSSLFEATDLLGKLAQAGDVVLFENDLPDNFNE